MPGVAASPGRILWSEYAFSPEREQSLKRFLLPGEKFKRYGYRAEKFSQEELFFRHQSYCRRCDAFALMPDGSDGYKERLKCRIHPGQKLPSQKIWSCCRMTTVDFPGEPSGCRVYPRHDWTNDSIVPQRFWDLHHTPPFKPSSRCKQPRKAVSLDCEMATNKFDYPELIKLTLVDVFTQEVLIDSLVKPMVNIKNMVTHIHGITYKNIISASNASAAILGRDAARERIFDFVGPGTMVLVHGGANDFMCLRWLHTHIVDTQEIESRVKRIGDDELDDWLDDEGTGLEAMCRLRTGIQIRTGRTKYGDGVHDSVEDAMACRELGVWYSNNLKGEIEVEEVSPSVPCTPFSRLQAEEGVEQVPPTVPADEIASKAKAASKLQPTAPSFVPTNTWFAGNTFVPVTPLAPIPMIPIVYQTPVMPGTAVQFFSSPYGPWVAQQRPNISLQVPLTTPSQQFWDCKVCNLKVPKDVEQQHRKEQSHINSLLTLIQQKGG
ncbi:hypothetical protein TWF730_003104 [Orbilia blumenaviensis]|uniref:Exonuclease domain-containing protein n=1 Tax=Orbilia blumenaviensis TaxID=1796055 RepID=A0AAV9U6M1_9PEZI